jgi:hypothetical protein
MTEHRRPWVGDLVRDPVAARVATISDVRDGTVYLLRAPGRGEWEAEAPDRLELITRREDRVDWTRSRP